MDGSGMIWASFRFPVDVLGHIADGTGSCAAINPFDGVGSGPANLGNAAIMIEHVKFTLRVLAK